MQKAARIGLIAVAALFAAEEASAQLGGGFPGGGAGRRGGARGGAERQQQRTPGEPRQDMFQTTLEELRIDLKLDAAQQRAWNAYAEKLVALMSDVARERASNQPGVAAAAPQTAPQQLDKLVMSAQNRATAMEEVAGAAKNLYAMLSPEQKSVADGRLANVTSLAAAPRAEPSRALRQP